MITGLFTDISGFGGVPRISQHVASILQKLAEESNSSISILSLNDSAGERSFKVDRSTVVSRGYGRRRIRFVLAALAKLFRSKVIYLAHPDLAPLGLVTKLIRPTARYVVATHGWEVWHRLPLLRRLGLRFADCVTSPSSFTAERLVSVQKSDPSRVVIIPWAVDPSLMTSNGKLNGANKLNPGAEKALLTVGRLWDSERMKGVDNVIRVLPRVSEVVPNTHYFIVGEGDDQTRLAKLAVENGVGDYVHFVGPKPDGQDLIQYYDACDVFVMPSKQEGFGLVFLEAMARGKAVIGANYGGAPDIIHDQVTGFLVGYDDLDSLTDRITRLLLNPELSRKMGEAGRDRVERNFSFAHLEQRLTELMNRLADH